MITFEVDDFSNMNLQLKRFISYLEENGVDGDKVFDSRLVSCELITNVLRHCCCKANFSGVIDGGEIIITVCAAKPAGSFVVPELPEVLAEGGRGLYIVKALSGGNIEVCGGSVTVKLTLSQYK